jgi:hypothetical protein
MRPVLSILEGKWYRDSHVTVKDLFSPLFCVWAKGAEAAYHYEQFTNDSAFRDAIAYGFKGHRPETIYVGAHGTEGGIKGFHNESISRTYVRNSLKQTGARTSRGIYFGACSFGTRGNADYVMQDCPRVLWMAGYDTETDWIDSGVLDLFFLRHFLFPTPGKGNPKPSKTRDRLDYACARVRADMAPLAKRLGMHVFVRQHSKVIDLLGK